MFVVIRRDMGKTFKTFQKNWQKVSGIYERFVEFYRNVNNQESLKKNYKNFQFQKNLRNAFEYF